MPRPPRCRRICGAPQVDTSAPAHQLGAGGSGTNAQKLLGGRTGGAEAWCNHAAG